MNKKRLKQKIILLLMICLMAFATPSQKKLSKLDVPSECEFVRHALDESILSSLNDKESMIIFILRKGRGELSDKILKKRADAIRAHFNFRKADKSRLLIAASDRTDGLGKLEIYVKGKLAWELFASRYELFGSKCSE